jgi:hypothetical protein
MTSMNQKLHHTQPAPASRCAATGADRVRFAGVFLLLCLIGGLQGIAQTQKKPPKAAPLNAVATDAGWPRIYSDGAATVAFHQPQVDDWKDFKVLSARLAVEIVPQKGAPKIMAAMHWEAQTDADLDSRTVVLGEIRITSFRVPGQSEAKTQELQALVARAIPKRLDPVALDRLLAYLDPTLVSSRQIATSTEAPPILVSTSPAILVMIDGPPILGDIAGTNLSFVINTNWDILKEKDEAHFYLLNGKQWLTAENIEGPWKATTKLPKDAAKIPNDENWADVKKALPLTKANKGLSVPSVFVTSKPAELILLNGEPKFQPFQGTMLSEVANTASLLFYDSNEKTYYFLTSGRWFRNQQLRGIWEYASDKLPADFARIPAGDPKASVRASVPGTIEASDAVLLASVPQMAVIDRKAAAAQAKVTYIGDPEFKPIANTTLQYAVNTPADVIQVADKYYLLQQGVWFISGSSNGPWEVADVVPQEIYSIPPQSPKHNTTYVYVTNSDPDTVTVAQTSGYMGMTVSSGVNVVVWGTGYYYSPYYYWGPMYPYPVYWGYPYCSYGAAAWYNPATGFYGRGAVVYGPYGGYGRSAAYNPATGAYVRRAGAWGPYQGAMGTSFYNPRTGAWGSGHRYGNAYQSWGQGVVGHGDQWAKGGYYSDSRGTVGGVRTSGGGRLVAAGNGDNRAIVGRTSDGDLYAGKDGNIYRRDQSGNWQQHGDGGWNSISAPSLSPEQQQRVNQAKNSPQATQAGDAARKRAQPGTATAATRESRPAPDSGQFGQNRTPQPQVSTGGARPGGDVMSGLDRDAGARARGSQSYGSWRSQGSGRSSGGFGGGGFGGRGGGRRR